MSTSALTTALSGLRAAQRALEVTSNNVANATTEGFTKKTLSQSSLILDGRGVGVSIGATQRSVDIALLRDYRTQVSTEAYYSVKDSFLERAIAFHGNPELETNISAQLSKLSDAFVELSAAPTSAALQDTIVTRAQDAANSMNRMADYFLQLRNQAQNEISLAVDEINNALENIATLNVRIESGKNIGKDVAALQDQRDLAVQRVAEYMDVTFFENGEGSVIVQTSRGEVLVDTEARPLTFSNTRLGYESSYPDNISGIILNEGERSEADLASYPIGGKLGALIELRDENFPQYLSHLDELAHKLATRFEAQNMRLFVDEETGVVPTNDPQVYTGFAARISVNQAVITDPTLLQSGTSGPAPDPGSNTVINNIIDYTFGQFQDASGTPHTDFRIDRLGAQGNVSIDVPNVNVSLIDFANSFITVQSNDHSNVNESLSIETTYLNDVQGRLLDQSGVNTDEEMARLIELEQSYAASARVIQTMDQLFQELLNAV